MAAGLPIDAYLAEIAEHLRVRRAVVVIAAPGAGKTTRVPPALSADGPAILLQPRRVAARAIARRIAGERNWCVGAEVGWHVRFERQFSSETRLLVATEGILTARLQQDPLLSAFRTVILDEFHERSIHADLGIALAKQAWLARDDLRIVVMSATLDARRASAFLDDCPVVDVPGMLHPVDIAYSPRTSVGDAVRDTLGRTSGHILCFLPGVAEIRRAAADIRERLTANQPEVIELHGSMPADEQDRALTHAGGRRVIVATNIAETSLTVPGVSGVVDSGQHKVARYDVHRGVDSLELERISGDSADQRAGRAGRLGPGVVCRLWDQRDRLRPHREPEIARVDLAGPVLDVLAWGGDPRTFEWFESPPTGRLAAALDLLAALGAVEGARLTPIGRDMARLAAHPRLARILLASGGAHEAAIACALLSERQALPRHPPTTTCDLLTNDADLPPHVLRHARELQRGFEQSQRRLGERELRRALLAGYPDRVARRRGRGDPRVLLTSGHGAVMSPESGVRDGEFLVAIDVTASPDAESRIRIASIVEKEWLTSTAVDRTHEIDDTTGVIRAVEREHYGALVLRSRPVPIDPGIAATRLADALLARPLREADLQLLYRLRFAAVDFDLHDLAVRAAAACRSVHDVSLETAVDWRTRQRLDEAAPAAIVVPSGRTHRLEYREDGTVALAVKLQELFGLSETPLIGRRREPLILVLLAPNGRPVQTTRDLRNFWDTTYQEVRKELRGRYPKHPWPDDPWDAAPTARTSKRAL